MFFKIYFGADLPTWAIFVELAVAGSLVIFLGWKLTHLADRLSDIDLNLGKVWIGLLLLATITSLPEVVAGGTAVVLGQPDLAFGNIFGSCMFNVAIVLILKSLTRRGSAVGSKDLSLTHSLNASMGMVLIAGALLGFALIERLENGPTTPLMSPAAFEILFCAVLAGAYLLCMRLGYQLERQAAPTQQMDLEARANSATGTLYAKFSVAAVLLIVVTIWLTKTGDILQDHPIEALGGKTLGGTFVGAFFLAAATSLPEIVTSVTAVRLGHLDLALGNLFGSNLFNIFVIPILKVVSMLKGDTLLMYGPQFSSLSHTITGLFAILITGVALAGLVYRAKRGVSGYGYGFDSFLIAITYVVGMFIILRF